MGGYVQEYFLNEQWVSFCVLINEFKLMLLPLDRDS